MAVLVGKAGEVAGGGRLGCHRTHYDVEVNPRQSPIIQKMQLFYQEFEARFVMTLRKGEGIGSATSSSKVKPFSRAGIFPITR